MSWREFFDNKKLLIEFIVTVILLIFVLHFLTQILNYAEQRKGVVLDDPVLKTFGAINLTWLVFTLIYFSIIIFFLLLVRHPQKLMFAIQAYALMIIIRIIAMYLMPLNPPAGMIQLNDPFVQYFGTGKVLTKDLFFSGHTATLFLFFLITENKFFKNLFLIFTALVAASVLLQHVHYSIDVFAAPFFSYASYKIVGSIHKA